MRNFFLFTLLFCVLGCTKNETPKENVKPYIISQTEKENKKKEFPFPPFPNFYGSNNFIIDQNNSIFYFERPEIGFFCAIGIEIDSIPFFENILPEEIQHINKKDISKFVKLKLKKGQRNFTTIASQIDTLNSSTFFELVKAIEASTIKSDRDFYLIRRTRQEEDTVIHYKKENKYYFPENIKWDKSRIKFIKDK